MKKTLLILLAFAASFTLAQVPADEPLFKLSDRAAGLCAKEGGCVLVSRARFEQIVEEERLKAYTEGVTDGAEALKALKEAGGALRQRSLTL